MVARRCTQTVGRSAFLCADLGIALEPRDDHASYLAVWLKVLRSDRRAIFSAAAHAQRAADYPQHAFNAAREARVTSLPAGSRRPRIRRERARRASE